MEILHVTLYKVLCTENNEAEVVGKLQKASDESHTVDVLLLQQEMHIFIF